MQHSNCYSNVENTDPSITSLNTGLFNGKMGSRLQTTCTNWLYTICFYMSNSILGVNVRVNKLGLTNLRFQGQKFLRSCLAISKILILRNLS